MTEQTEDTKAGLFSDLETQTEDTEMGLGGLHVKTGAMEPLIPSNEAGVGAEADEDEKLLADIHGIATALFIAKRAAEVEPELDAKGTFARPQLEQKARLRREFGTLDFALAPGEGGLDFEAELPLLESADPLVDIVDLRLDLGEARIDGLHQCVAFLGPVVHAVVDVVRQLGHLVGHLLADAHGQELEVSLDGPLTLTNGGELIQADANLRQVQVLSCVGLTDHAQTTFVVVFGAVGGGRPDLDGGGRGGGSGDDADAQQGHGDEQHDLHDVCSFRADSHGRHARWVNSGSAAVGFGFWTLLRHNLISHLSVVTC